MKPSLFAEEGGERRRDGRSTGKKDVLLVDVRTRRTRMEDDEDEEDEDEEDEEDEDEDDDEDEDEEDDEGADEEAEDAEDDAGRPDDLVDDGRRTRWTSPEDIEDADVDVLGRFRLEPMDDDGLTGTQTTRRGNATTRPTR